MLSEDENAQTNESRQDQVKSDKVIQESWKDKNQKPEQDRQQRSDVHNHSAPPFQSIYQVKELRVRIFSFFRDKLLVPSAANR
jgi:hypothetical protein